MLCIALCSCLPSAKVPGAGYSAQCRSAAVGVPRSAGHWEYPIYREIHEVDFGCTLYINRIQGKNILPPRIFGLCQV